MDTFAGVDPGNKGAICLYTPEIGNIVFIDNKTLPHEVTDILVTHSINNNIKMVCIEDVHSIFGTSAKSNFTFGYNTGLITGIIQGLGLPLHKVQPKVWQKHVGVTAKGEDIKKDVGKICSDMFPSVPVKGPRGGLLDGRSDALMIAVYCAHKFRT